MAQARSRRSGARADTPDQEPEQKPAEDAPAAPAAEQSRPGTAGQGNGEPPLTGSGVGKPDPRGFGRLEPVQDSGMHPAGTPQPAASAPAAAPLTAPGLAVAGPNAPLDPTSNAAAAAATAGVDSGHMRLCDDHGGPLDPETLVRDYGDANGGYRVTARRIHYMQAPPGARHQPNTGATRTVLTKLLHPAGAVISRAQADALVDAARRQAATTGDA